LTFQAPKRTKLKIVATRDNNELTQTFTQVKTHNASAPVRPVSCTGQTGQAGMLGMNNTCGSTPPNPTPDLPNLSTVFHKTLGIVGTPHGHSIAKIWSTKTCQNERNRRNPTKNASNPRAKKIPKIEPFCSQIWEGNQRGKNHEGFKHTPPPNPKDKGLEIATRKSPRKGSEITKRTNGKDTS
jgi:hypothetical protein